VLLAAVLAAPLAGCQPAPPEGRGLVVTGYQGLVPLLREVGKRFESSHPGVRVDVTGGGSDRGVADARRRLADVGLAARPLKPEESGLLAVPLALDGLALVVHQGNPARALSDEQLSGLLTRAVTNWKQVGGNDAPVVLVGPGEGRLARQLVLEHFHLTSTQLRAEPTVADGAQAIQVVATQPSALGYVPLSAAWEAAGAGQPVRLLPLGGVAPTAENVRGGRYRAVRTLALLLREPPAPLAQEFVDYARSAELRELVQKYSFVPVAP
jgi:phosphate transport system substrate-binding protein